MQRFPYQQRLLLRAAASLVASHGVYFAAAMLADLGVPIEDALDKLVYQRRPISLRLFG